MKNINWKAVSAILAVVLATEIIANMVNVNTISRLNNAKERLAEISMLMAQKLDDNGIDPDAFDEMIIHDLTTM